MSHKHKQLVSLVCLSPKWCQIIDNDPETNTQYYTCIDTLEKCWEHLTLLEPELLSITEYWNHQKKVFLDESHLAEIHFIYNDKDYLVWVIKGEYARHDK